MCFEHFKIGDLEALEKGNAYPPRFFLILEHFGLVQNFSTVLTIRAMIKSTKEDNIETLTFSIHTMDYMEFKIDKRMPLPSGKQLLTEG